VEINRKAALAPSGEQCGKEIAFYSKTGHLLFRNARLEHARAPLSPSIA
jgi:hypothetical protein